MNSCAHPLRKPYTVDTAAELAKSLIDAVTSPLLVTLGNHSRNP